MATDADRIVALERLLKRNQEQRRAEKERLTSKVRRQAKTIEKLEEERESLIRVMAAQNEDMKGQAQTIRMLHDEAFGHSSKDGLNRH